MTKPFQFSNKAFDAVIREQGRMNSWVAEQMGVDPSYVSKLRNGERRLTEPLALKAALVLKVPVARFIESDSEAA